MGKHVWLFAVMSSNVLILVRLEDKLGTEQVALAIQVDSPSWVMLVSYFMRGQVPYPC
jgi:hypothetical protein